MLSKECKIHMEEAGMTRWQHFWHAVKIAYKLEKAATRVVIHALLHVFIKHTQQIQCVIYWKNTTTGKNNGI